MSGSKLNDIFSAASQYRDEGMVKINDDRVLIKVMDPSESAQFACLIPEKSMYEFDDGGVSEIAINYSELTDFIPSTDDEVQLIYNQFNNVNKLVVIHEGSEIRVPAVKKSDVPDVQASIPNFDMPVEITADPSFMLDFINKCKNINTDFFMISPREELLYLYGKKNDSEIIERKHWNEFIDHDLNWDKGNIPDSDTINNPSNPAETHEVDVLLSNDLAGDMMFWADASVFHIDNHMPLKIVFEDDEGIKVSWMLAPRLPKDGNIMKLPENVVDQKGLREMMA